jgi:RNA polymerase sigma factor (sigma-70 family)
LKAIDKFDPDKGRLGSYARNWIWNEINRSAEKTPEYIKLPPPWHADNIDEHELNGAFTDAAPVGIKLDRLEAAAEEVLDQRELRIYSARELGRDPPTFRELGAELEISGERVRKLELRATAKVEARLADPKPLTRSRAKLRQRMAEFYLELPLGRSEDALNGVIDMVKKRFPEATAVDRLIAKRVADYLRPRLGARRRTSCLSPLQLKLAREAGEVLIEDGERLIPDGRAIVAEFIKEVIEARNNGLRINFLENFIEDAS